jgi:hypothetical protein
MLSIKTIAALLLATSQVHAANDWTKPCFQGSCSWDVVASDNSIPGTMQIVRCMKDLCLLPTDICTQNGNPNAISDITDAAGWQMVSCDKNKAAQDIKIKCKSTDAKSAGCDHLFQNGAEETIVRLPQNVGHRPPP